MQGKHQNGKLEIGDRPRLIRPGIPENVVCSLSAHPVLRLRTGAGDTRLGAPVAALRVTVFFLRADALPPTVTLTCGRGGRPERQAPAVRTTMPAASSCGTSVRNW